MVTTQFKFNQIPGFPGTKPEVIRQSLASGNPPNNYGVYLDGIKFLRIENQPSGIPSFISNRDDVLTRFCLAENYFNLALIAHNHLAGKYIVQLALGSIVYLIDGMRKWEEYLITRICRFRALQPRNPNSLLQDLLEGEIYTAEEVFRQFYMGRHHLIFQTCISSEGNNEWGRYFLVAEPVQYL